MSSLRLGIDLGGSKTEIIALDQHGHELARKRNATPREYDPILDNIAQLVRDTERGLDMRGSVGIATPGALSPRTGLLRNANTVCLNGKPIKQDLEQRLQREVRIANDANCFALSEASDGAGRGAALVLGVIIGTGVGGGIVVNGKVLQGPNSIAGEWGHNSLPWPQPEELPGPACYCGKHGCIETFLSGPGLTQDHARASGVSLPPAELALHSDGEASLQRYEHRLARALAHVINLLDPDVIVLGGGLSNLQRLYQNVPRIWTRYVFSDVVNTRLLKNVHGDSSGVRGAARLWS